MDLSVTYLGLRLSSPLMPGASPMVDRLDLVRRLEDAGAAAIVMHSLFEEQIIQEQLATVHYMDVHSESFAEAVSYFPRPSEFALGPEQYLGQLARIKAAVAVPVIASLNGVTPGGWVDYARRMEEAGADALELNTYYVATDPAESPGDVERRTLDILAAVRAEVAIPVAVKLSPFHSSLAHFAAALRAAGADGLILFNRFYQPELDVEALEVIPRLELSTGAELLLRLRWLAILRDRTGGSLAASGGVQGALDAIKAIMAGADVVQLVSALLRHGPEHLVRVRREMEAWMADHGYASLDEMRGCLSLSRSPDPGAFERANYIRVLQGWRV
ncbi:MAG: dihydroorotate dehydrogenase-like protein [Armatimonadota bacterium]|nr:dihydroorotate dehydrogenase-like protein [Armatimonadota bacterium]MDR7456134.1 dihydroorotate dehydrogenase-like protein [Armatimonadota bacterium]MDR7497887.1 dihydroorotate dehydrogenase-like protein [Armatimonadota bacterium]MDR7511364.1 dihydroorotate dehydrogenase-like protein [Armatimonadota bacterium]